MTFATSISRGITLSVTILLLCHPGRAQEIQEFPTALRPTSIVLGPDGAMWFTQNGAKVGRIDASGVGTELPIPAPAYDIAVGSDGNLWMTTSGGIARMTLAGVFTLFPVAGALQITSGPDGNIWFTKDLEPRIGRITSSGVITEFSLPSNSLARHISGGPDGNVWFTKPDDKIGRITASGAVTEFATPMANIWPFRIAAGPDGNVWYTEAYPGLGRITPEGGITEFSVPDALSLASGADGNLWAAGFGILRRITPAGVVTAFSIPTGTFEFLTPAPDMAAASDGSIWITDFNNSKIVRFFVASPLLTCVADPLTLCLNGGRFRVTSAWKTREGGAGPGKAAALTPDAGYFWFFAETNVELFVKVLSGCAVSESYWLFAAGLTNVEVTTTVVDTQTGLARTYVSPGGSAFAPIQDTETFSSCP